MHAPSVGRVIASAERLELEYSHSVVAASSAKAVDAARYETLRAHIGALRELQLQCSRMQALSEGRAEELSKY